MGSLSASYWLDLALTTMNAFLGKSHFVVPSKPPRINPVQSVHTF